MENPLHATEALLHDPLSFNYLKDGPPYLPGLVGGKVAAKIASEGKGWIRQAFAEAGRDVGIALDHGVADYGGAPMAELAVLLASLRAEAMIHQAHHWQTRGQSYYGDHLLFERVYGEVNSQVDGLAERAVGKGDTILVQPLLQMSHMATFTKLFYSDAPVVPTAEEMPLLSLRAVLKSAVLLQLVYGSLEDKGQLSHGLDNLLQGIADKQESLVYLLKQRVKVRSASTKEAITMIGSHNHDRLTSRVAARYSLAGVKLDKEDVLDIVDIIYDNQFLKGMHTADFGMDREAQQGVDEVYGAVEGMAERAGRDAEYTKALLENAVDQCIKYVNKVFDREIKNAQRKNPQHAKEIKEEAAEFNRNVRKGYKP